MCQAWLASNMEEPLVEELLEILSNGHASKIQSLAAATLKTCVAPECIRELAELGSWDPLTKSRKNVERDLHRWAKRQPCDKMLPEPYEFELWGARRGNLGVQRLKVKALLPHEVLGSVHAYDRQLFAKLFVPSDAQLDDFWRHEAGSEWMRMQDAEILELSKKRMAIPLGIWGDDAAFNRRDKLMAVLWNSVLKVPSARILCGALHHKRVAPTVTINGFYDVLVWSLTAAYKGVHPSVDHRGRPFEGCSRAALAGQPIAGGYRFPFSEVRGDLPFQITTFGWVGFNSKERCCHLCLASREDDSNFLYSDFRPTAAHRDTLISHDAYMQSTDANTRSPVCRLTGFHLWRVWQDAMHTLDLGIFQHLNGSTLWHLTATPSLWPSTTRPGRLLQAHEHYVAWCRLNRVGDIADPWRVEHFKKDKQGYPKLTSLKAAEQRWLVVYLHAVLTALPRWGEMLQLLVLCYSCAVDFDVACRKHGRIIPEADLARVVESGKGFLTAYNAVALYCAVNGMPLYSVIPKHHMYEHLMMMARVANPRFVHNYSDESMIGRLKRVASECHADAISHRVVDRYRLLMLVKFSRM